jgi:hypothetical protein
MKFVGNPDTIPARTRTGVWKEAFEKEFSQNPGKIYEYVDVSSSTAANLRRDYGLDAQTTTVEGEMHLYVVWRPEQADEIKAQYKPKKVKVKGTANGQTKAATPAPATAPAPAGRK